MDLGRTVNQVIYYLLVARVIGSQISRKLKLIALLTIMLLRIALHLWEERQAMFWTTQAHLDLVQIQLLIFVALLVNFRMTR